MPCLDYTYPFTLVVTIHPGALFTNLGLSCLVSFKVHRSISIDKSISRIVESFKSYDGLLWNFQLLYVLFEESTINEILKMHQIVFSHDNDIVWMGSKNGSLHVALSIRLLVESKEVRVRVDLWKVL